MRDALLTPVRRFPATNVTLYGCLFAGGDFVHQRFSRKERVDWAHTRNVVVVAFGFHGNFHFFVTALYTGVSFMQRREEILQDWRETVRGGCVMYWPGMQVNPSLLQQTVMGWFLRCGFIWAPCLCFWRLGSRRPALTKERTAE
uniref:Uncharacterized protein n=1 Tax=Sinocyclocheilus anshuiensis TaxID=1608454 RepID=A0A671T9R1_9TELE